MKAIHSFFKGTAVALFAAVVLVTSAQVIARYVFNNSFTWAEETARYLFVWASMIAAGLGFREGAHLSLDILEERVSPRLNMILIGISILLIAFFCTILIVFGTKLVLHNASITSPALKISLAIPYAGIPVGGFLVLLFSIEASMNRLKDFKWGQNQGESN